MMRAAGARHCPGLHRAALPPRAGRSQKASVYRDLESLTDFEDEITSEP